jgi:DNA topoisomerase-1
VRGTSSARPARSIKFDGFLAVYEEGKDEKDEDDDERAAKLPKVTKGEKLQLNSLTPNQHFTDPPPRYTEATLVKALEEKGIGRPSTYASIMSVIQDREYVEKLENRFHPTELGIIVNDLLVQSFAEPLQCRVHGTDGGGARRGRGRAR